MSSAGAVNITLDDTSRYLSWEGDWSDETFKDSDVVKYYNQSFHYSKVQGESMKFSFLGTGIWVYGAARFNHGTFNVTLDGGKPWTGTTYFVPDKFKQVIWSNAKLDDGVHTVVISNENVVSSKNNSEHRYLDIDYITFTGFPIDPVTEVIQYDYASLPGADMVAAIQSYTPSFTRSGSAPYRNHLQFPTDEKKVSSTSSSRAVSTTLSSTISTPAPDRSSAPGSGLSTVSGSPNTQTLWLEQAEGAILLSGAERSANPPGLAHTHALSSLFLLWTLCAWLGNSW